MFVFKHFEIIPFLAGLGIGLLILFFWKPKPELIQAYPHPSNVDKNIYRDPNGICYKYQSKEVDCDANESTIKPYPIQNGKHANEAD